MNRSPNVILSTVVMLIAALATLTALPLFANRASALPAGFVSHGPILIDGDAGFTSANGVTSGSGTLVDPYVVEGWDINASSANGIEVRNTTAYFIIRNCYVHDGGDNNKHGIYFETVKNWKIENVTSVNNFQGIFLVYSSDGIIDNCTSENNLGKGIWIWYSQNDTVINCVTRKNHFEDIHLWHSDNNIVENCVLEGYDHGITIDSAENDTVTNCSFKNNNFAVYFNISSGDVVENCTVAGNNFGVTMVSSSNNAVTKNIIENSKLGYKIDNSSENNHIYHNDFVNNVEQAIDYRTNYWDNGYPSGGNYWSDYRGADNYRGENQDIAGSDGIGDAPYQIQGGAGRDRYPLMSRAVTEVEVSSLRTEPSVVEPSKPVTISVDVKNKGDLETTYWVKLKINGAVESIENVALAGGETKSVAFTVTREAEGNYEVEVDGIVGTFTVVKAHVTPSLNWLLIIGFISVTIAMIGIAVALYIRKGTVVGGSEAFFAFYHLEKF
jgi:parallel beta-helix repeat protein